MIVGMNIVAIVGVGWLAIKIFHRASVGEFIARLPGFLALGLLWLIFVMFGGLLLGAFAETYNTQEPPGHKQPSMATAFFDAQYELD